LGSNEGGAVTRRCRADSVLCRQSRNGGVVDRGRWLDGGVHRAATALDLLLGSAASLVQAVVAFHGVLAALPGLLTNSKNQEKKRERERRSSAGFSSWRLQVTKIFLRFTNKLCCNYFY